MPDCLFIQRPDLCMFLFWSHMKDECRCTQIFNIYCNNQGETEVLTVLSSCFFSVVQHVKEASLDLFRENNKCGGKREIHSQCGHRSLDYTLKINRWQCEENTDLSLERNSFFNPGVSKEQGVCVCVRKNIYIVAMETLKFSNLRCYHQWHTLTVRRLYCSPAILLHKNDLWWCPRNAQIKIKIEKW